MPPVDFGPAYLDAESFRLSAELFGVGMAMIKYPDSEPGNEKLTAALKAASRAVDTFCGKNFLSTEKTETCRFDLTTWQFTVNNPPVAEVTSCAIRYAVDATLTVAPANVFINNQRGYLEIARNLEQQLITAFTPTELKEPVIEIVYKSLQEVPPDVALATAYQTAHMINSGFADYNLPPNMGKVDLGGMAINNKKGSKSQEEMRASSFSPDAERLLSPYRRLVAV